MENNVCRDVFPSQRETEMQIIRVPSLWSKSGMHIRKERWKKRRMQEEYGSEIAGQAAEISQKV